MRLKSIYKKLFNMSRYASNYYFFTSVYGHENMTNSLEFKYNFHYFCPVFNLLMIVFI